MKFRNKAISWVLAFLLAVNPVIFEAAVWAQDAQEENTNPDTGFDQTTQIKDQGVSETDAAADELNNTKKVKSKSWWPKSAKKQVKKANQQLGTAKDQVNDAKDKAGEVGDEIDATRDAATNKDADTFEKMAAVAGGIQRTLIKVGQLLQSIGQLLNTVGTALVTIGTVLSAIPYTAAIGKALVKVGKILIQVGKMLDKAGKAIEAVGNTAADADASFGDKLKGIFDAARDGWREGGEEADRVEADAQNEMAKDADTTRTDAAEDAQTTTEAGEGDAVQQVEQAGE